MRLEGNAMIQIRALDGNGELLAEEKGEKEAFLCVDRVWQEGDRVEISGARQMKVQMDQSLLPGEVYLPEKRMTWRVPAGEERLGYAPGMFETPRHLISARVLEQEETAALRNLAMNPADLRGETDFYPHVFANVETRNEAGFAARNVIDGIRANHSHGEWPWGSWGIGAREDAWCQLDFGREVLVEEMALTSPLVRLKCSRGRPVHLRIVPAQL